MERSTVAKRTEIQAVIFDLDGTLVDSETNYYEADRRLLAEYGILDFDQPMKEKYVGFGSKEMLEDIKVIYQLEENVEALLQKKNRYYLEIARENTVVFPEMKKFLELLKAHSYTAALASGSSPEVIDTVLEVTKLQSYFDIILSAEHVRKGKPAPDIFLETARRLGLLPGKCLVVEDSRYGVEAAKNAAMLCLAIPYLSEAALHESFYTADLLFRRGMSEFTAEKAMAWLQNHAS